MPDQKKKVIVAITGASGSIYALRLLEAIRNLRTPPDEVAVVFSDTALKVWEFETGSRYEDVPPAKSYQNDDFFAPFASGSSTYGTMIICPASMGTIGRIAGGVSDDLICRAADVNLKERRRLIVVPRETPYNLIHLRNMETLTLAGAVICPATPSFYSKPATIDGLVMTVVERIISLAGLGSDTYHWMEND